MSTREPPMPGPDPLAEAAALIRDVGRSTQHARRYRDLAVAVAEPILDRTLAIGSDLRRAARGRGPEPATAIAAAIAELRNLLARCEEAIDGIKTSSAYQEAVASFAAGEAERVAPLATAIFTDVIPYEPAGFLYWAVPLSNGRSGTHFLAPEEVAARLYVIAIEGFSAAIQPPELGGDETIRPVMLTDQHEGSESPLALAFEPHAIPAPVCRLEGSNVVLFYAERLAATFVVSCTANVNDEWWKARPDTYRQYLEELRDALSARALRAVIED